MKVKIIVAFLLLFWVQTYVVAQKGANVIHVKVALCDNKFQGIVKVPKAIGNGQDANNNLYWGCGYGIRTYFKKQPAWTEVKRYPKDGIVLERIVFKHKTKPYYLVADAYDGQYIQQCTVDFLNACAGKEKKSLTINNVNIGIEGNAKVLAYIGHNGLMDFSLSGGYKNTDGKERDAIILACASKQYFSSVLARTGANPLLWTTNLMCPEAYTLYDALETYMKGKNDAEVRNSAAAAYSKFQKCSVGAAKKLLVTGW